MTFQQVQKYERGANRISSSQLFNLSRVLHVSVEFFFDDMLAAVAAGSLATKGRGKTAGSWNYGFDPMAKRETLELVRVYFRISDPQIRKRLYELTKAVSASDV